MFWFSTVILTVLLSSFLPSTSSRKNDIFVPKMLTKYNECYENFCSNVPNYPLKEIENIVDKLTDKERSNFQEMNNRIAINGFVNNCINPDYTKEMWVPQVGQNIQNKTRFIVNVKNLRQELKIIRCGKNCGEIYKYNNQTTCRKEYIEIPLIVITEMGQLKTEDFLYHTNCYCACEK